MHDKPRARRPRKATKKTMLMTASVFDAVLADLKAKLQAAPLREVRPQRISDHPVSLLVCEPSGFLNVPILGDGRH